MDEIVAEFLVESHEGLDQLDRDFLELERHPANREVLASVFRALHTVKGTAGFLGFSRLESVTHVGESLMSRLRDGEIELDTEITEALLALVDTVRSILDSVERAGDEGAGDDSALIGRLTELLDRSATSSAGPTPEATMVEDTAPEDTSVEAAETDDTLADDTRRQADATGGGLAASTIRVDVALLDRLMNLVGELVLARNQVLQCTATQDDIALLATSQRLNLITTELQEGVMKTRMQPIDKIWSRLPRVVRDLAMSCGKRVELEMEGRETELDKTVLEAISDPLTHIVRNSIDHGIESPDVRAAAGKSAEGRLLLRAFHEGGLVNIEIIDDGAGINLERVKATAVRNGVVTAEQAERLGERELANLVFLPGFSTADSVTNVSGRGVGMDVVRTNVERIGGTLDMHSRPGEGTTIRIKIPLTLAIIPALVVTTFGERYAIPQVSLVEVVRLEHDQARDGIELIQGAPVYRLRGNLLPLVYLSRALDLEADTSRDVTQDDEINIVVLQADDRQFGLVVDEINDVAEIVVKPLGRHLKAISCFAGATIMGDGAVALILDALGLAQRTNVVSEASSQGLGRSESNSGATETDANPLLIVTVDDPQLGRRDLGGDPERRLVAVPLDEVARLEEFDVADIEHACGRPVIQYRGEILPLVRVGDLLGVQQAENDDEVLRVVVHSTPRGSVGLVVDSIEDIVEEALQSLRTSTLRGVTGSALIQGKVTDLLDVAALVDEAVADLATSDLVTSGLVTVDAGSPRS